MIHFRPKLLDTLPGYSRGLFTSDLSAGITVVIFIPQIKDFLGLDIEQMPGEFFGKMEALYSAIGTLHLPTVLLATASLGDTGGLESAGREGRLDAAPARTARGVDHRDRAQCAAASAGRYHRQPLRRHSAGVAVFRSARGVPRPARQADRPGADDRDSGRDRVAAVRPRRRQSDRRPDGSVRIQAYRLFGSLFFGAANKLDALLTQQEGHPDVVILDLDKVISIDTTGLDILQTLHRNLSKRGITLILSALNAQPGSIVSRSGFLDKLGPHNVADNLNAALIKAQHVGPGSNPEISYV